MTDQEHTQTVGELPAPTTTESSVPRLLTRFVWVLWVGSLAALVLTVAGGRVWQLGEILRIDGLTILMWVIVTFVSGIVHSYSRRYMAGSETIERFFVAVSGFTLVVLVLVAADNLLLFGAAWLGMGLVMADLIGSVRGWPQAQTAAALARRYFLASTALLGLGLVTLWWHTGATTISGVAGTVGTGLAPPVLIGAGALVLAAMIQSALIPFHTWLLASMTAPTPASALMHAGFVNAGGLLLVRFAPVVTVDARVMTAIVLLGGASALGGKLFKSVQADVKSKLGCSTVGQMGFMLVQAGLGFFAAAIAHLILHGFYKAYQFLSSGGRVTHEHPSRSSSAESTGITGVVVVVVTAVAGGALFATLTGKGTELGSGLVLTLLVVLTVLHATRQFVTQAGLPTAVRYGTVPLVTLPALAVYAAVYNAVAGLLAALPAVGQTVELTAVHWVLAVVFLAVYVAIERDLYQHSNRLYVGLLNATRPPTRTLLTSTEEYNEY